MRVAFITNAFPVPSQTFILDQITGLISRGIEIDIYALRPGDNQKNHNDFYAYGVQSRIKYSDAMFFSKLDNYSKAFCLNFFPNKKFNLEELPFLKYRVFPLSLRLLHKLLPFFPQKKYDIIHAHFGPCGIKGQLLRDLKILNGKLVTSFHGYDLSTYLNKNNISLYNRLFSKGDLFLPISKYWNDKLITMGCNKNKICIQHMGVDCNKFKFITKSVGNNKSINIVSIARLTEKKGLKYSIKAVCEILKQGQNIFYQIVGNGTLKSELQSLINKHGYQNHIKLVGWKNRDEVIQILAKSDLLVAPSVTASDGDMEGVPMVLMEAMAMGIPVISTIHSGIPELIEDEKTGFLVKEQDIKALIEKINHVIKFPALIPAITKNARQFIEHQYSLDKQNDKLLKIYKKLS